MQNISKCASRRRWQSLWCAAVAVLAGTLLAPAAQAKPKYPFQNPNLPLAKRVNDLVARLTPQEEALQLRSEAPAIPRLGIPAYYFWNECLHGDHATPATVFPEPIGLAAAWDVPFQHKIADAISDEDRAYYDQTVRIDKPRANRGLTFFVPNINIFRDPRWGRGMETYGEDPYLTSQLAVAFITGLQGNNPRYLKVGAAAKHFAVHSGPELMRHWLNAVISDYDLFDTYLPAFGASVLKGHVASVMTAYSSLDGSPCTINPRLQSILRTKWRFHGFVVSDYGAVIDLFRSYHVGHSIMDASVVAVKSGCDLDLGSEYNNLLRALRKGLITKADLDIAAKRVFTIRFRLGMFDPPSKVPYSQIPMSVVDSVSHRRLARQSARESIVLLKNNGALPIASRVRSIAVIGPNADSVLALLGNYNGLSSHMVTVLEGLKRRAAGHVRVSYVRGCGTIYHDIPVKPQPPGSPTSFERAVAAARQSDLVVFVGGYSTGLEGEQGVAGDRPDIVLPKVQENLIKALVATHKPVVVVLLNGGPITANWCSVHAAAIVDAWYPGEEGGDAVADVLFGDYNPAGRLPVTVYKSLSQLPAFTDYSMKARTYRYFPGDPLYPFGFGLSYTRFAYHGLSVGPVRKNRSVTIHVQVANIGRRGGDEVAEIYLQPDPSGRLGRQIAPGQPMPRLQLAGFTRIDLPAGARRTVSFTLLPEQFRLVDMQGQRRLQPGQWKIFVGGRPPDLNHPQKTRAAVLSKLVTVP